MSKINEANVEMILKDLHAVIQEAVETKEIQNYEIMAAVLNFLVESVALLDLDEKHTLEFINKDFCKHVRKLKKRIETQTE
jgi:hypothetical protein